MPNPTQNLPLDILASFIIITIALTAISKPISRIREAKRKLKATRFRDSQAKLNRMVGGNK